MGALLPPPPSTHTAFCVQNNLEINSDMKVRKIRFRYKKITFLPSCHFSPARQILVLLLYRSDAIPFSAFTLFG
jgi:hypothetical protein